MPLCTARPANRTVTQIQTPLLPRVCDNCFTSVYVSPPKQFRRFPFCFQFLSKIHKGVGREGFGKRQGQKHSQNHPRSPPSLLLRGGRRQKVQKTGLNLLARQPPLPVNPFSERLILAHSFAGSGFWCRSGSWAIMSFCLCGR